MSQLFRQFLDEVGVNRPSEATPAHLFPVKARVATLGTVGAGKSAVVGGMVMAAETLVADNDQFFCRVIEGTSDIHQDVSDLRDGHFPRKTVPFSDYATEAGLLLERETRVGPLRVHTRRVQNPICDLAGEDLAQTIRQVRMAGPLGNVARQAVRNLIAYVRESDAFIVCIKATRAKGLFERGEQLEPEEPDKPDGERKLSRDPDVNLVRLLEDLINYKQTHRSRPIRGMAVVITAWDRLKQSGVADRVGFDILNPHVGQNDLHNFVKGCFPAVYAAIRSMRIPHVQFFPSFFEVDTDEQGNPKTWPDGSPLIKQRRTAGKPDDWWRDLRKISCSEDTFVQLDKWLLNFAV